jgi:hypothetical protein
MKTDVNVRGCMERRRKKILLKVESIKSYGCVGVERFVIIE